MPYVSVPRPTFPDSLSCLSRVRLTRQQTERASSFIDNVLMTPTQTIAFMAQMTLTCSVSLLTHASMENGKYAYNTLTIPLFAELTKLAMSGSLFLKDWSDAGGVMDLDVEMNTVLAAAVPALLYFISNNLNFIIIKELGPTNFQLLNNLKILATAVFFRLIMKVHLNSLQWRMLIMLTVGCTMSQLTGCVAEGGSAFAGSTLGYSLKLCNACLTALGSVFCEKFLKGNRNPFHFQNLLLYAWGSVFTIFSVLVDGKLMVGGLTQLISGHSVLSFCLIANYAFVGIATSGVMKYLDNIAKTFAATGAMFVVAAVAVIWFGEPFRMSLVMGGVVAALAVEVYYHGETLLNAQASLPHQSRAVDPDSRSKQLHNSLGGLHGQDGAAAKTRGGVGGGKDFEGKGNV